jgi:SAM-dependent methyltransferase
MNPGEYEAMARSEASHWWYRGLRDAIRQSLERPELAPRPHPRVLDAGCGTGENLRFLAQWLEPSYLGGFDASDEALAWARRKAPGADVYRSDVCHPELHSDELDLVLSLDVVYIPGAEPAFDGLRSLVGRLRRGGLFVLNLPAYEWLYSQHDVAVHTSERYTARRVCALLERLELRVERLSYRLCLLFPAVVMARLPGMWRAQAGDEGARSDLHAPPGPLANRLLFPALRAENALIARGARLPWGSSVFAIGRRP